MHLRVLGTLTLKSNGTEVPLPGGKVGDLLRIFLLSPGEVCTVEQLCEALWPEADTMKAKQRLHVTISRLRAFLERHADGEGALTVERDADGYRLDATTETLDLIAFEKLAEQALAGGDPDTVDRALELWDGEPYAGFEWTAKIRSQRSRLLELHRSLVETKIQTIATDGSADGFARAKFLTPRLMPDSVLPRKRLVDATPSVGEVTILAVTAPAGFGKSVFLVQWARQQPVPVVWVSVDEEDNDPARFWSGVVGAIAETGRLDLEQPTSDLPAGSAAFLDTVSEMVESSGTPVAVVIDDFHLISNESVLEQVLRFMSALPESATVAFGSRSSLAFPTGRLGAAGRLHNVTASDLRFTAAEVESVVRDRSQAERLWRLTEGWPVAVIALRASDLSSANRGESSDIADYLIEEVLSTVPPGVEKFLLEVAHLDQFNHRLCDAVTGRHDTAEMIAWLQAHQLFVIEPRPADGWFRLHHLIASELRRHAEADRTVEPAQLHRRAAEWFLEEGMKEECLRYAVRAREPSLITATVGDVLVETALRQEMQACLRWLSLIEPDDVAGDLRSHSIALGLASVWGTVEVRRRWAQSRSRHFGGDEDVVLMFHDGIVAMNEGRSSQAIQLFEKVINQASDYAADVAPDLVGLLVGMAFSDLVEAKMFQGDLEAEDELFSSAIGLTRPVAPAVAAFTQANWALVAYVEGSNHLAESLAEEYYQGRRHFDIARRPSLDNSVVGALAAARGTVDPAEFRRLAEGIVDLIDIYSSAGAQTWVAVVRLVIAALFRAGDDLGEASTQQRRAETLLRTLPDVPFLERLAVSVDEIVAGRSPNGQGLVGLLAPREREVLAYLTTDLTNEQIARELYVSPSTVHSQVSSIYRKLGVRSRHRAVLKVGIDNIDLAPVETSSEDD